jgi:hypothetical protein
MIKTDIPGYTYGTDAVPRSPVSLDELELLQATLLLGENDRAALRRSSDILAPQVDAILDVWYGFVGANPHLLAAFTDTQPGVFGGRTTPVRPVDPRYRPGRIRSGLA